MAEYTQTYWNELIDKYRDGTISDKERFQLEKQALDDPFLFDALEGFSLFDNTDEESEKVKTPTKIFTLSRIAVAASVVFLVAVMFNLNSNKSTQPESDNTIAMVMDEDGEKPSSEDLVVNKNSDQATSSTSDTPVNSKTNTTQTTGISNSEIKEVENKKRKSAKTKKENNNVPITTNSSTEPAKVEETEAKVVESEEMKKRDDVEGYAQDKPVGEAVATQDDVKEVVVDLENSSSLESDELKQETEAVPISAASNVLNESDKRKRKSSTLAYFEAVPVIGKKIFDDYAKERIDERGLRQEKPQKVTIEFTIDKNGNLTDFRHIFSGCPECGPFAISILQNSGEWKTVPPGFAGKARYTFTF